jgi:hypothetical protein
VSQSAATSVTALSATRAQSSVSITISASMVFASAGFEWAALMNIALDELRGLKLGCRRPVLFATKRPLPQK